MTGKPRLTELGVLAAIVLIGILSWLVSTASDPQAAKALIERHPDGTLIRRPELWDPLQGYLPVWVMWLPLVILLGIWFTMLGRLFVPASRTPVPRWMLLVTVASATALPLTVFHTLERAIDPEQARVASSTITRPLIFAGIATLAVLLFVGYRRLWRFLTGPRAHWIALVPLVALPYWISKPFIVVTELCPPGFASDSWVTALYGGIAVVVVLLATTVGGRWYRRRTEAPVEAPVSGRETATLVDA